MRYVIVSVLKGDAGDFNDNLRKEIWEKFKAKSSKLPAHFTIKAPFEYEGEIKELKEILDVFCKENKATYFDIDGYDHFDNRVIFMKVNMSDEGKAIHNKLIDKMSLVPYIKFDKKDEKEKVFHVTIASKNIKPIYDELWKHISNYSCYFKNCYFDNVSIYKWDNNTWKLFEEFKFQDMS